MPIAIDELNPDFILVDEHTTVAEVRDRVAAAGQPWIYLILVWEDGRCTVLRLAELIGLLQRYGDSPTHELLAARLGELPGLVEDAAAPVERGSLSTRQAYEVARKLSAKRLVVRAGGEVLGVLAMERRSAALGVDLGWLDRPLPPTTGAAPPLPSEAMAAAEPAGGQKPAAEPRWINAEIQDHDPAAPLQVGQRYTLAFDVDTELRALAVGGDRFAYRFAEGEEMVELTVQLSSADFEIHTPAQPLRVPRTGRSPERARFQIEPKHEGAGVLNAVFLKQGNFVQLLTLRLAVGAAAPAEPPRSESIGRPLAAAFEVQPRDLSLIIENTGTEYRFLVCGAVCTRGTLPITEPQLDQMITQTRQELLGIVNLEVGPERRRVYQLGIDIPPEVEREALRRLAKAGFRLYQRLFYGPAADAQTRLLGDRLRQLVLQEKLKVQIFSQNFPLPWAILYLAESYDPENVDPERFLGLGDIVEHLPLQNDLHVISRTIESGEGLTVSLNVNADIDRQMGVPLVAGQLGYWERLREKSPIQVIVRRRQDEVTRALADTSCEDQILYFYCHAVSRSLSEGGGPDASNLVLSGGESLTLEDLNLLAPLQKVLPCAPLVFINACESAELSPLFYEGFVPYFMAKGARGVIGTECAVPALFASEWARRFFDRFLGGGSLGEVVLELRREFYHRHRNILGLLYALYCDADTQVVPGVPVA